MMTVFVACLAVPIIIQLGPLRLSPYRIVLLLAFLPCISGWLVGAFGRTRAPDLIVLAIAGWSAVSFIRVHGAVEGIESAGIVFVETLTPYLLARLCIRSLAEFQAMVRLLVCIVVFLSPFALIEVMTSWNGLIYSFDLLFQTFPDIAKPSRLGLDRVQGPFEHPILFGVFIGSSLALSYYSLLRYRVLISGGCGVVASLSLSSGPLTALIAQAGMIVWDRLLSGFQNRWIVAILLAVVGYVVVDLVSSRSPAEVFISYAAFNSETAYNRLLIWDWGWVNIWQNPWFGLGNNDWQRLWYMTASVDMFWVQRAMVHGLPVGALNQILFFVLVFGLSRIRGLDARVSDCRTGLIFCLIGFYVGGMTVHFWNATFVWLMFLMGAALWMFDVDATETADQTQSSKDTSSSETPKGLLAIN